MNIVISSSVESVYRNAQISQQEMPLSLDTSTYLLIDYVRESSEIPLAVDYAIIHVEQ
jgi:hypothetical protein